MRNAIEIARKAGWHLRQTLGHGYGRAFCRRVERGGTACKVIISTTPQLPEDKAKDFIRQVRDCPHHFADQLADIRHANDLLDGAGKLLDAAEDLLDAEAASLSGADAWSRAQELLDLAASNADEVERVMDLAQKFDEEARRLTQSGWTRGVEAYGGEAAPGAYVSAAEERVEDAAGVAARVPYQSDPLLADLKGRVAATKSRIVHVGLRLGHGRP